MKKLLLFLLFIVVSMHGMDIGNISDPISAPKKKKKRKCKKKKKNRELDPLFLEEERREESAKYFCQRIMKLYGQSGDRGNTNSGNTLREITRALKRKKLNFDLEDEELKNFMNKDLIEIALHGSDEIDAFMKKNGLKESDLNKGVPLKMSDARKLALYLAGRICLESKGEYVEKCKKNGWNYYLDDSARKFCMFPLDWLRLSAQIGHGPARFYLATNDTELSESKRLFYLSMLILDETISKSDKKVVWDTVDEYEKKGYFASVMAKFLKVIKDKGDIEGCLQFLEKNFLPIKLGKMDYDIYDCGDCAYEMLDKYKNTYWSAQVISSCLKVIKGFNATDKGDEKNIADMIAQIGILEKLYFKHSELQNILGCSYAFLAQVYESQPDIKKEDIKKAKDAYEKALKYAGDEEFVLLTYNKFLTMKKQNLLSNKVSIIEQSIKKLIDTTINYKIEAFLIYAAFKSSQNDIDAAKQFLKKAFKQMTLERCSDPSLMELYQEILQEITVKACRKTVKKPTNFLMKSSDNVLKSRRAIENAQRNGALYPLDAAAGLLKAVMENNLFCVLKSCEESRDKYDGAIRMINLSLQKQDSKTKEQINKNLNELDQLKRGYDRENKVKKAKVLGAHTN